MKTGVAFVLVVFIGLSIGGTCGAQDRQPQDVRATVQALCRKGDASSAFHMAMKSWTDARQNYGDSAPYTAECITALAEAAFYRREFYLAELLYEKALSIQEKALGASHFQVVRTKLDLAQVRAEHGW